MGKRNRGVLNLRAGDVIEVRSAEEILATLDRAGRLDNMPFMPEMLQYCGKRFRVFKRADKTCDNIQAWSIRRIRNTVHLEGLRCDGAGHGSCQAACLIFWKEAWLKRAGDLVELNGTAPAPEHAPATGSLVTVESIFEASCRIQEGEAVYTCQATELRNFSTHLPWWDFRQYIRDVRSGNLLPGWSGGSRSERALEMALSIGQLVQVLLIGIFNKVQEVRHEIQYPWIEGVLKKTQKTELNLQPGELVQVRSREEIVATLDKQNRNRGLLFDAEMLRYCGGIYRVVGRVNRIVDERTGKMLVMKNPCIVLEGVYCRSDYHRLCPRAIYSYWRENWLVRANPAGPEGMQAARQESSEEYTVGKTE
jgi:hypothetical protein